VEALASEEGPDVLGDLGERVRELGLDLGDRGLGGAPFRGEQRGEALGLGGKGYLLGARVGAGCRVQPSGGAHRRDLLAQRRVGPADGAGQLGDGHRALSVQPDDLKNPAWLEVIDAVVGVDASDLVVHV
jgi:hypothetical protein